MTITDILLQADHAEIERACGVGRMTVWRWRIGSRIPGAQHYEAISRVTGFAVDEIVDAAYAAHMERK